MLRFMFCLMFSLVSLQQASSFEVFGVYSGMTKSEFMDLKSRAKSAYFENQDNPTSNIELLGQILYGRYNAKFCERSDGDVLREFSYLLPTPPFEESAVRITELKENFTEKYGEPAVTAKSFALQKNYFQLLWQLDQESTVSLGIGFTRELSPVTFSVNYVDLEPDC